MQKITKEKLLETGLFEDCEYLEKYISLINKNEFTKREQAKTQHHHIIPKCYYTHNKLKVNNSKDNMVHLLYKDHILAHFYMYKSVKETSQFKHLLGSASYEMTKCIGVKWEDIDFENEDVLQVEQELYEQYIINNSGKNSPFYGRHHSEESKEKIRQKALGRKASQEARDNMSKSHLGSHRSEETKRLMGDQQRGRKMCYEEPTHKIRYYNPNKGETLPEGCIDGMPPEKIEEQLKIVCFQKGHLPWNTGMETPQDVRDKISKANTGQKRSVETREKISQAQKGIKKKPHTDEWKANNSAYMKGRIWVSDGKISKFIQADELGSYIQQGFHKGRN